MDNGEILATAKYDLPDLKTRSNAEIKKISKTLCAVHRLEIIERIIRDLNIKPNYFGVILRSKRSQSGEVQMFDQFTTVYKSDGCTEI